MKDIMNYAGLLTLQCGVRAVKIKIRNILKDMMSTEVLPLPNSYYFCPLHAVPKTSNE